MNKTSYQSKSGNSVLQAIKGFLGKLRQNPDVYPVRYYKKNRRYRNNFSEQVVK